jgi:hypothetical protein
MNKATRISTKLDDEMVQMRSRNEYQPLDFEKPDRNRSFITGLQLTTAGNSVGSLGTVSVVGVELERF